MTRAEELAKQGWVNKGTYDEPRLSEIIAMYEDIGLKVHLEPFDPSADPGCTDCMGANAQNYKTIYTKVKVSSI